MKLSCLRRCRLAAAKITDALLAQLTEKPELYTKLATEYESQLQFAESLSLMRRSTQL
jgi:hypothetical protein